MRYANSGRVGGGAHRYLQGCHFACTKDRCYNGDFEANDEGEQAEMRWVSTGQLRGNSGILITALQFVSTTYNHPARKRPGDRWRSSLHVELANSLSPQFQLLDLLSTLLGPDRTCYRLACATPTPLTDTLARRSDAVGEEGESPVLPVCSLVLTLDPYRPSTTTRPSTRRRSRAPST